MQKEVFGDRYQVQEPIGRGGMATVYRGLDLRMERVVAVKVLREAYSMDPKFVTRFQREAKAASSLHHPNIVQVYDYGQSDGSYYIVMELIEGTDLRRYLRARRILAVDRAVIIAHDVAMGLGAAHRRDIVNRDVKPQNILVGRDGSIKLTDFGIAMIYKDINTERLTTTGMTLGTVQYYAPEQAQGEIVTPAADVYALGIVMYEMLTGRTPFDGDTPVAVAMQHIQDSPIPPSQYNPNIPPALEDIIMRCLEKVPEMRYRNGTVLAQALETFMEQTFGDSFPDKLGPGVPRTTTAGPSFNPIPSRPNASGMGRPGGQNGQPASLPGVAGVDGQMNSSPSYPPNSVSSPNNMPLSPVPPPSPAVYNQQTMQDMNANTIASNGLDNDQTIRIADGLGGAMVGAGFAEMNGANAANGVNGYSANNGNGFIGAGQQPVMYNQPDIVGSSGSTRPFDRGVLHPGSAQNQRDSRFTGVVTALILVATLIFLGFSIFLASQLGVFNFLTRGGPQATSTTTVQTVPVPDVKNEDVNQAKADVEAKGFKFVIAQGSPTQGKVTQQNPRAGEMVQYGSTIEVTLTPVQVTPTVTVPTTLNGTTVDNAKNILQTANIKNYTFVNAGSNANYGTNIVDNTNPTGGSTMPASQSLQVYVWNCTADVCTVGTPVAPPPPTTAPPTPTPTTALPTPTPTSAPPTPTPTTAPPTPTTAPPTPTPTTGLPKLTPTP